jgi:hypothetical protein
MVNIAVPYVVIAVVLLVIKLKVDSKNYIIATNFIYSILSVYFLMKLLLWFVEINYYGVLLELFEFIENMNGHNSLIHFVLLFSSLIPPFFFLHPRFRSNLKFHLIVVFSSILGILDGYLFPYQDVSPNFNPSIFPVYNGYIVIGTVLLLSVGSILLVKLKILPEFRRPNNKDILDATEN